MSKKKILITVIVIVAIGVAAIILASYKSPVSPGVSEEIGGGTEPVSGTEAPEGTPVSGTKAPEGTPVAEKAPSEQIEYKIIAEGQVTEAGGGIVSGRKMYDIVTGKINEEKANTLAKKIIADITSKDSKVNSISLYFYSDESFVKKMKIDVAIINWVPNEISVRMIKE